MKRFIPRRALALLPVAMLLVAGCANENSIFRMNRLGGQRPAVITMDAKQRNVMMVHDPARAGQWRVCAEASPDVFSALSTSAASGLGFGQSGGQTDAQAQASLAIAEAAGTIERTQTINMLRESMYRTCERYMSGAIDQATFVVQAGRDWRAMIAILAIEQLTRTARPPSTIISAGSTTARVESAGDAMRQLAAAQGRVETARRRIRIAQDSPPAVCPPPSDPAPSDADVSACTAKTQAVSRASEDLAQASADVATWQAVLSSGVTERSSASTGAGDNDPGGSESQPISPTNQVALTVGEIVRRAFDTDETQLFCLQVLSPQSQYQGVDMIRARCIDYLLARIASERQQLLVDPALQPAVDSLVASVRSTRERVLSYLSTLTPEAYEQQAATIRATVPVFCVNQTLAECRSSVEAGRLDGVDQARLAQAISEAQAGRQW